MNPSEVCDRTLIQEERNVRPTLHQLEVFCEVARRGSFTRAAEHLSISQPTVSGQIKQLAQTVGLPLFEQIGRRLFLTEAGEALLTTSCEMFDSLERFQMTIDDFQGKKRGRLKLGVVTTAQYIVPRLLGHFCQAYPDVDVSLQVTNHAQLTARMEDNRDDLYIISQPPAHIDLELKPFIDNSLVVVTSRSHALAQRTSGTKLPIRKLAAAEFVMREAGSGTRRAIERHFAQHGISNVCVRLELSSNEAIIQAVAGGLGVAILSRHCLEAMIVHPDLVQLDVTHFPIPGQWYVAHLHGKQLSVVAQSFREQLLSLELAAA